MAVPHGGRMCRRGTRNGLPRFPAGTLTTTLGCIAAEQPKLAPAPRSAPQTMKLARQHANAVDIMRKSVMLFLHCGEVVKNDGIQYLSITYVVHEFGLFSTLAPLRPLGLRAGTSGNSVVCYGYFGHTAEARSSRTRSGSSLD